MNAKLNIQSKHKENRLFCTRFIRFLIALAAMTVSTTSAWGESIKYLKYVGGTEVFEEATANDATQITSSSTSLDDWYYVDENVTINNTVELSGNTTIILCDDVTLHIKSSTGKGIKLNDFSLTIYAQSSGSHTGELIIYSQGECIFGWKTSCDVTINGGSITARSYTGSGINCGKFTVNGGNVTAIGSEMGDGIYANSDVTINGGKVSASGNWYGISANYSGSNLNIKGGQLTATGIQKTGTYSFKNTNLEWTNASDCIESNSYSYEEGSSINVLKDFYINGSTSLAATDGIDGSLIANKKLTPKTTTASFAITIGTGIFGGAIEVDKEIAFAGERVAINVTPDDGNILASLTYNDGTNTYTIGTNSTDIKR